MNRTRIAVFAVAMTAAALALAGCSIVNTTSSEVALQYGGGPFDSVKFVQCTDPGTRETRDVNDDEYYYPTGQRDWTFGTQKGADSGALSATSADGQQLDVEGTIKFELNTSCSDWKPGAGNATGRDDWPGGKIQAFHELIDSHYHAAPTDGGADISGDSWDALLRNYLGAAVQSAANTEAGKYNWQDLYSKSDIRTKWINDVKSEIPDILRPLTFNTDMIKVDTVLLQKPGISQQLQDGLTAKQAAALRAQSVQVDENAAKNFPGGIVAYQRYQEQQAINDAIKSGKVKVLPVPQGTSVIVGGN